MVAYVDESRLKSIITALYLASEMSYDAYELCFYAIRIIGSIIFRIQDIDSLERAYQVT